MPGGPDRRISASQRALYGGSPAGHDVFICHASEDKKAFVEPLAKALQARGVDVWYDAFSIEWGDRLRDKIDSGVASCRYGIVVLSPAFFAKKWTQYELDGLAGREFQTGEKVILPVWHRIDHDEVASHSPSLAERTALPSSLGVDEIAKRLVKLIRPPASNANVVRPGVAGRTFTTAVSSTATSERRAVSQPLAPRWNFDGAASLRGLSATPPGVEADDWVTVGALAKALGVTHQRAALLAHRMSSYQKVGLSWRVSRAEAERLIDRRRRAQLPRNPDGSP